MEARNLEKVSVLDRYKGCGCSGPCSGCQVLVGLFVGFEESRSVDEGRWTIVGVRQL